MSSPRTDVTSDGVFAEIPTAAVLNANADRLGALLFVHTKRIVRLLQVRARARVELWKTEAGPKMVSPVISSVIRSLLFFTPPAVDYGVVDSHSENVIFI